MARKVLEGIKVADFSWALVGPITGKTLADYGAEVIKIEGRSRIDQQRTSGFFKDRTPGGTNRGSNFNMINTSKGSLVLNLVNPKAIEISKQMVKWADVVIENFAGGVFQKLGLGYEELKKIKPDIIMLSSCMMGQTGPHSFLGGMGAQLSALVGLNHITGWPDRGPTEIGPETDFIAPIFNVVAIIAALDYRRRTGKGQYIDMSQYENAIHFMTPVLLDYQANKRIANREGNRLAYAAPHGVFPCKGKQRWCAIAVFTDEEWDKFCRVIGNPEWSKESRFATLLARKENEDTLDKLVGEWTNNYLAEEVMTMMQTSGVAAGIVENGQDLMEFDPQLRHRHFFWTLEHPDMVSYRTARPPYILSKTPCEMKRAPLLGEHNEYALKQILGMSDDEVAELIIAGAVE